ncbi:MAG: hypothetical protein KBT50_03440, partial [Cycloclasticus sp.]|nr:hypothetical protein [Cycloclasticus sp.]MBQ0789648.1 hypothetical protein [Cycloclasticus sp.]
SLEDTHTLKKHLQRGDVLLIEGNRRISTAIKYLTQSTWSHAALYVGDINDPMSGKLVQHQLIEADLVGGVIHVPIEKYNDSNTRICRPVGLNASEQQSLVNFMVNSIGKQYDHKNIIDLLRYLFPTPPVPSYFRRHMLTLGSGDPTRAICSTLIAEAYQSITYPILPLITPHKNKRRGLFKTRHHSLFVPRDFDISPFFNIIKPEIIAHFDHRKLTWDNKSSSRL